MLLVRSPCGAEVPKGTARFLRVGRARVERAKVGTTGLEVSVAITLLELEVLVKGTVESRPDVPGRLMLTAEVGDTVANDELALVGLSRKLVTLPDIKARR